MFGLATLAAQHRAIFEGILAEAGEGIVVRQPAVRTPTSGTDVSKMLGSRPSAPAAEIGETRDMRAVVSGPPSSGAPTAPGLAAQAAPLGKLATCDLLLRVRLSDALTDPLKPFGKTLFETAKDVQVRGSTFRVEGVERGGLAPLGPYFLWVGLNAVGS